MAKPSRDVTPNTGPLTRAAGAWPAKRGVATGWRRTFSSLRIPGYRWLWIGLLAYFMAMMMDGIARGYLAYDLTGSATSLGLVSIAWGLPMLILSLVGGVVADRTEKRNLLLACQLALALVALITAILVHTGAIKIWHLVLLGFGQGATWAFIVPARQALIPELVGEDELMNALALSNGAINVTRILGPAVAGGLIAVPMFGTSGVFYTMVLLYGIVVLTLLRVPATGTAKGEHGAMWQEMTLGVRYVTRRSVLVVLIGIAFVAILLGMPYSMLLPVFAEDVHHVGSVGLGVMSTFVGMGAVVGSLVMAYLSDYPHRAALQLFLGVGFGVGLLMFGGAPAFVLALAALSFTGFMATGYMTLNNTLIFSHAERQFHGRVMSVYMLTWSLMPLTALPMSMLTDVVGAQVTVAGAGALVALFIGAVGVLYPGYRAIGRPTALPVDAGQAEGSGPQARCSTAGPASGAACRRS